MILRQIGRNLREQNWFTLLIELVVVVVGIFLGLQVDAWNSAQRDRAVERRYLERLLSDMEESVALQQEMIDVNRGAIAGMDALAKALHAKSFDDEDIQLIKDGLNSLGWVALPVTNLVTVRELQSTGNISLIQDIPIRKALGKLELSYALTESNALKTQSLLSSSTPEIMAWAYFRPGGPSGGPYSSLSHPQTDFGFTIEPDFEVMMSQPGAANSVSWVSAWTKYHGALLQQHLDQTVAFRDLLRVNVNIAEQANN